jgi:transposase
METGAVDRGGGHTKIRPGRLIWDKAYSSGKIRTYLTDHHIGITIPRRRDESKGGPFNKTLYRLMNRIERFIHRIKHFRAIATRFDKSASSYQTLWIIAAIFLWLLV